MRDVFYLQEIQNHCTITPQSHAAFFSLLQTALLLALREADILTESQLQTAMDLLRKRQSRTENYLSSALGNSL